MGLVTPDFGLLFWMLVSFGLVLFILKKFAWKPILKSLKDREYSIQNALDSAKEAEAKMQQLQSDNDAIMQKAKKERELLIKEAREAKEQIISDAKMQAKSEIQKMKEMARQEIENEKNAAIDEIKEQVGELSIQIAEKVLKHALSSESKQQELIQQFLGEANQN